MWQEIFLRGTECRPVPRRLQENPLLVLPGPPLPAAAAAAAVLPRFPSFLAPAGVGGGPDRAARCGLP